MKMDPRIVALTGDPQTQRAIAELLAGHRERLLPIKEAASLVGAGRRTIERALERGELQRWRPSIGRVCVDRTELLTWFTRKYPIEPSLAELAEVTQSGAAP